MAASTAGRGVYMKTRALCHAQLVKTLYKKAVRAHESRCVSRLPVRYGAVIIRRLFDKNRDERDLDKIEKLMELTETQIHWLVGKQKQFSLCPGGISYQNYDTVPDVVMDLYHPMEKAAYPRYFAKREIAKRDYILWWEKTYGNTENIAK